MSKCKSTQCSDVQNLCVHYIVLPNCCKIPHTASPIAGFQKISSAATWFFKAGSLETGCCNEPHICRFCRQRVALMAGWHVHAIVLHQLERLSSDCVSLRCHPLERHGTAPAGMCIGLSTLCLISQNTYKSAVCFWPEVSLLTQAPISALHAFVLALMAGRQDCHPWVHSQQ